MQNPCDPFNFISFSCPFSNDPSSLSLFTSLKTNLSCCSQKQWARLFSSIQQRFITEASVLYDTSFWRHKLPHIQKKYITSDTISWHSISCPFTPYYLFRSETTFWLDVNFLTEAHIHFAENSNSNILRNFERFCLIPFLSLEMCDVSNDQGSIRPLLLQIAFLINSHRV